MKPSFFCMYFKKVGILFLRGEKHMKDKKWRRNDEDSTKYGEFISSYFAWKTLDEQKDIADKLADITDKEEE